MLLLMRTKVDQRDLNVSNGQRLCVLTTGLGWLGLAAGLRWPIALALPAMNLAVIATFNRGFYRFLGRTKGAAFALAAFPLHYLYFCCCGVSVMIAHAIQARHAWNVKPAIPVAGSRTDSGEVTPAPKSGGRRSRWFARSRSR
jgi:hypothetical protein